MEPKDNFENIALPYVRNVKPTLVWDEIESISDYYNTKEDRTKPHTEYVKDAIERGVKL